MDWLGKARRWVSRRGRPANYEYLIQRENFSQYAEDAMLFAALKPVGPGFYVDVGAQAPIAGSNTFRLYRNGWRGLTLEPNPAVADEHRRHRPRDNFVNEGVSEHESDLTYFEYAEPWYNTFSAERRDYLIKEGRQPTSTRTVRTRPLRVSLDEISAPHIDFLSIDCEGYDEIVLRSLDFTNRRPTAILVEDFEGFRSLRDGHPQSNLARMLRDLRYQPVAQCLFSTLYVAKDWPELFRRSKAYSQDAVQASVLPEH